MKKINIKEEIRRKEDLIIEKLAQKNKLVKMISTYEEDIYELKQQLPNYVCACCGVELGELACGARYAKGSFCSPRCADQADFIEFTKWKETT